MAAGRKGAAAKPPEQHSEAELVLLLAGKHPAPEWAFFPRVRDGTGGYATRTADAIALGLWPSRGMHLHGFELKSRRNDWRRELRNPAKADEIGRYCDFWWIVAPAGVVPRPEVPDAWGLMEATGEHLRVVKPATKLEAQPLSRHLVAAIFRRATGSMVPREMLDAKLEGMVQAELERRGSSLARDLERASEELAKLRERVAAFEKASGVSIGRAWDGPGAEIGAAVRVILNGNAAQRLTQRLRNQRGVIAELLSDADRAIGALEAIEREGGGGDVEAKESEAL